jgi:oligo-1,6-glucosidase
MYYYQKLIKLRHDLGIVTTGRYRDINAKDANVYSYLREDGDEALLVVCNFTAENQIFSLPNDLDFTGFQQLLSNYPVHRQPRGFTLKPYESTVFLLRQCTRTDVDAKAANRGL